MTADEDVEREAPHFKVAFTLENADFEDNCNAQIADILRNLADEIEGFSDDMWLIRDNNGNRIGLAEVVGPR